MKSNFRKIILFLRCNTLVPFVAILYAQFPSPHIKKALQHYSGCSNQQKSNKSAKKLFENCPGLAIRSQALYQASKEKKQFCRIHSCSGKHSLGKSASYQMHPYLWIYGRIITIIRPTPPEGTMQGRADVSEQSPNLYVTRVVTGISYNGRHPMAMVKSSSRGLHPHYMAVTSVSMP